MAEERQALNFISAASDQSRTNELRKTKYMIAPIPKSEVRNPNSQFAML